MTYSLMSDDVQLPCCFACKLCVKSSKISANLMICYFTLHFLQILGTTEALHSGAELYT